ncbi:DUF72 domain-containing protein [Deferrisoma palaeochoriense]
MGSARAWIGTSGWAYPHWRETFYPAGVPQHEWLAFYARRFQTVEVNRTFYGLPKPQHVAGWARAVPEGFRFAVKGSRLLTHTARLRDPAGRLGRLLEALAPLGAKRGPLLLQFPPGWAPSPERLRETARACPRGLAVAVELRGTEAPGEVRETLRELGWTLVVHDHAAGGSAREVTGPFAYLRFHGPGGGYRGEYGVEGLRPWARWIKTVLGQGLEVYAYFNNDAGGAAPRDAARLIGLLDGGTAPG